MLRRPELLAAAVLLRPMVPFVSKKHPDPSGKSVCLGAGQHDPIVTAEETLRVEGLFRECGAGVFLQSQPHGHEIGQEAVSAVRDWLTGWMTRTGHLSNRRR